MTEPYEITMLKIRMSELQNQITDLRRDVRLLAEGVRRLFQSRGDDDGSEGSGESPAALHVAEGN